MCAINYAAVAMNLKESVNMYVFYIRMRVMWMFVCNLAARFIYFGLRISCCHRPQLGIRNPNLL